MNVMLKLLLERVLRRLLVIEGDPLSPLLGRLFLTIPNDFWRRMISRGEDAKSGKGRDTVKLSTKVEASNGPIL